MQSSETILFRCERRRTFNASPVTWVEKVGGNSIHSMFSFAFFPSLPFYSHVFRTTLYARTRGYHPFLLLLLLAMPLDKQQSLGRLLASAFFVSQIPPSLLLYCTVCMYEYGRIRDAWLGALLHLEEEEEEEERYANTTASCSPVPSSA